MTRPSSASAVPPRRSLLSKLAPALAVVLLAPVCLALALFVDRPAALFLKAHIHGPVELAFKVITSFGLAEVWLATSFLFVVFARWKLSKLQAGDDSLRRWVLRYGAGLLVFASSLASGLVVLVLKVGMGRARPSELFADGKYGLFPPGLHREFQSFPSGHSQSATAALVALGMVFPRLRLLCWAGAALIASSRFFTTVHYLSDTMMGACIGAVGAIYMARLLQHYKIPYKA